MDGGQFDELTRRLGARTSRRRALFGALGLLGGGAVILAADQSLAARCQPGGYQCM